MECLDFKDLFTRELDVFIDEKLFMAYIQIMWNQLTVCELPFFFFFFFFLIIRNAIYDTQKSNCVQKHNFLFLYD
jgi:hypothetical protein